MNYKYRFNTKLGLGGWSVRRFDAFCPKTHDKVCNVISYPDNCSIAILSSLSSISASGIAKVCEDLFETVRLDPTNNETVCNFQTSCVQLTLTNSAKANELVDKYGFTIIQSYRSIASHNIIKVLTKFNPVTKDVVV